MSTFPLTRLRRLRSSGALRSLVRETRLDLDSLVLPLFVGPTSEANASLPALGRYSVEELVREAEECAGLGVPAVILFGIPEEKDEQGSPPGVRRIVRRALRARASRPVGLLFFSRTLVSRVTSHGHWAAGGD